MLVGMLHLYFLYLCNELDDLDKDIKGHVFWDDTPRPFREQRSDNIVKTSVKKNDSVSIYQEQ